MLGFTPKVFPLALNDVEFRIIYVILSNPDDPAWVKAWIDLVFTNTANVPAITRTKIPTHKVIIETYTTISIVDIPLVKFFNVKNLLRDKCHLFLFLKKLIFIIIL